MSVEVIFGDFPDAVYSPSQVSTVHLWNQSTFDVSNSVFLGPWGVRTALTNFNPYLSIRDPNFAANAVLTAASGLQVPSGYVQKNYFAQDATKNVTYGTGIPTQGDVFYEKSVDATKGFEDASFSLPNSVTFPDNSNCANISVPPFISKLETICYWPQNQSGEFEGVIRVKAHTTSRNFANPFAVALGFPGPACNFDYSSSGESGEINNYSGTWQGDGLYLLILEYTGYGYVYSHGQSTNPADPSEWCVLPTPGGNDNSFSFDFPNSASNELLLYVRSQSYAPEDGIKASGYISVYAGNQSPFQSVDRVLNSQTSYMSPWQTGSGASFVNFVTLQGQNSVTPVAVTPFLATDSYTRIAFQAQRPYFGALTSAKVASVRSPGVPNDSTITLESSFTQYGSSPIPYFQVVDDQGIFYTATSSSAGRYKFNVRASTFYDVYVSGLKSADSLSTTDVHAVSIYASELRASVSGTPISVMNVVNQFPAIRNLKIEGPTNDPNSESASFEILDPYGQLGFLATVAEVPVHILFTAGNVTAPIFRGRAVSIIAKKSVNTLGNVWNTYEITCSGEWYIVQQQMTSNLIVLARPPGPGNTDPISGLYVRDAVFELMSAAGVPQTRLYWDEAKAPGSSQAEILPVDTDTQLNIDPATPIGETVTKLLRDYLGFYTVYDVANDLFRFEPPSNYGGASIPAQAYLAAFTPSNVSQTSVNPFGLEYSAANPVGLMIPTMPIFKGSYSTQVIPPIANQLRIEAPTSRGAAVLAFRYNTASFDPVEVGNIWTTDYSFLGRPKPLMQIMPEGASVEASQFLADRVAQYAMQGRRLHRFMAPLFFVQDSLDLINPKAYRPLRYYDAIFVDNYPCYVRQVQIIIDRASSPYYIIECEEIVQNIILYP